MRPEACLFLLFCRLASKGVLPTGTFSSLEQYEIMRQAFQVTQQELYEISEILKADLREMLVMSPEYEHFAELLAPQGREDDR